MSGWIHGDPLDKKFTMTQAAKAAGPLAGITVVDLSRILAGPYCTLLMAEMGARVIKVEPPKGGDPLRLWRKLHAGTSLWWHVQNRNKLSVTIDLRSADGQALVRRIVRDADIVIENFKPGTMEKWGLGYDVLSVDNPRLVMVRLSGFGQTGPMRDQAGFGVVGEAMGGLRYVTGFPDRPPVRPNLSIGDALAAMHGVIGGMMALEHCRKTGKGQVVDVALYEAVFNMMEGMLPEFDMYGEVRERTGTNLTGIVPSNTYLSREGEHVVIGGNGDSIFKRLMQAIGRSDLADDPSLADNAGRAKRADELDDAIGAWTRQHDADTIVARLNEAQVPNGKIYNARDMVRDPQFIARQMIRSIELPDGTRLKVPGVVPRLSATPGDIDRPGPALGEHTEMVLKNHGLSDAEIAGLRERKVI